MTTKNVLCGAAIFLAAVAIPIMTPAIVCAVSVANLSFEEDGNTIYLDSANAIGWQDNAGSYFFTGIVGDADFHTDGSYGVLFIAPSDGFWNPSDNIYIKQSIDLTGITSILFDAQLSVHPDGSWMPFLEADVYVDTTLKWSNHTPDTYLNQSIDVTGLTGAHNIEFRLQANTAGSATGEANWYEFDNVRLVTIPEPSSMTMFAASAIGLLIYARRRKPTA